jgi:hypothetical protein
MKKILITMTVLLGTCLAPNAFSRTTVEQTTVQETTTPTQPVPTMQPAPTQTVEDRQTTHTESKEEKKEPAGLFIEPSVTYENGKGAIDFASLAQPDGNLKGYGLGLRFGGHISDVLFLALDGSYSKPKFEDENGNFSYDLKSWLLGVTLGLQTPVAGLRVWGSYIPVGEMSLAGRGANDSNIKYKDPRLWKVGVGLRVKVISLNLEYLTGDYTTLQVENAGSVLSGNYDGDFTRKSWIASVSFPFAL